MPTYLLSATVRLISYTYWLVMMSNWLMVTASNIVFHISLLYSYLISVIKLKYCYLNSVMSLSQRWGGIQSHVRVTWLGKAANDPPSEPAAILHARHHGVRCSLLGGQFHREPRRPDQRPESYTGGGESHHSTSTDILGTKQLDSLKTKQLREKLILFLIFFSHSWLMTPLITCIQTSLMSSTK